MGSCGSTKKPLKSINRKSTRFSSNLLPSGTQNQIDINSPDTAQIQQKEIKNTIELGPRPQPGHQITRKISLTSELISDNYTVIQEQIQSKIKLSQTLRKLQNNISGINYDVLMRPNKDQEDPLITKFSKFINHPNIVQVVEVINNHDFNYVIFETCSGPSLRKYIKRTEKDQGAIDENLIIFQITEAIRSLHQQGQVHGNLTLKSFKFLDEQCKTLKLINLENLQTQTEVTKRSIRYASPELIKEDGTKTIQSDIWSCGVIIWRILTKVKPYAQFRSMADITEQIEKDPLSIKDIQDSKYQQLLKTMLNVDPNNRTWTRISLLKLPLINNLIQDHQAKQYNYIQQCFIIFIMYHFNQQHVSELWMMFRKYQINEQFKRESTVKLFQENQASYNTGQENLNFFLDLIQEDNLEFDVFLLYFSNKKLITESILVKTFELFSNQSHRITQTTIEQCFSGSKSALQQCLKKYVQHNVSIPNLTLKKFQLMMSKL